MKNLSNTEAGLKKSVAYKKVSICLVHSSRFKQVKWNMKISCAYYVFYIFYFSCFKILKQIHQNIPFNGSSILPGGDKIVSLVFAFLE